LADLKHSVEHAVQSMPVIDSVSAIMFDGVVGVISGGLVLAGVSLVEKVRGLFKKTAQ
jgi:predicted DNA repair protein MutK